VTEVEREREDSEVEWGWRSEGGSWFQRHGEIYRKERSVIRREDDVGGRARVTGDRERVLQRGWMVMVQARRRCTVHTWSPADRWQSRSSRAGRRLATSAGPSICYNWRAAGGRVYSTVKLLSCLSRRHIYRPTAYAIPTRNKCNSVTWLSVTRSF